MPRQTRSSRLQSRSSRSRLLISTKPYDFVAIAPGAGLGYRRNKQAGAWVLRLADGKGGYQTRNIGLADDLQEADGVETLSCSKPSSAAASSPKVMRRKPEAC